MSTSSPTRARTANKKAKKKAKSKSGTGAGAGAATPSKPTTLVKTKAGGTPAPPKPLTPKQKVAAMRGRAEVALDVVWGKSRPGADSDDEDSGGGLPDVTQDLQFDQTQLNQLAKSLQGAAKDLKDTSLKDKDVDYFERALSRLTDRVTESRRLQDKLTRIAARATALGVDVRTESTLKDSVDKYEAEAGRVTRDGADGWLNDLESRVATMETVLNALNGARDTPLPRVPADLIAAAGTDNPLDVLRRAVAYETNPDTLRALLLRADVPKHIPNVLAGAAKAGVAVNDVLNACPAGPGKANAALAAALVKTINDTGQTADYFLTGEGGQQLGDLRFAASAGAPVWAGQRVDGTTLKFGTPAGSVSLNAIIAIAEPLPVGAQELPALPPGTPPRDRYVGGREFLNVGAKQGTVLPAREADGATLIRYTEYDVRAHTGPDRGKERVVEGSDGSRYYTDDHYQTFRKLT